MRSKKIIVAILAVALVLGMTACPSDSASSEEQLAVYTAMSDDRAFILTITNSEGSAASHTITVGDNYVLSIIALSDGTEKKSEGKVTGADATLTLTPTDSSTPFTVTVSGGNISAITGTITLNDDTTVSAPASVTAPVPGPSLVGTWISDDSDYRFKYTFRTKSYELSHIADGQNENSGTYITYPKGGKNYLITIATLGYHDTIESFLPLVFSYEYSISGTTLTLKQNSGGTTDTYTKQ